jgi:putative tryptophan/tyrosine transport system permease protein
MMQLIGSFSMGLILSLLALGVLISFRILAFRDLTVEGSITLGGAVAATLLVRGWNPWLATFIAFVIGMMAGTITGILATRLQINGLLAGIMVMTALFSVNLRVMGYAIPPETLKAYWKLVEEAKAEEAKAKKEGASSKEDRAPLKLPEFPPRSNVPLIKEQTLVTMAQQLTTAESKWTVGRWEVPVRDLYLLGLVAVGIGLMAGVMYVFFKTNLGLAMRATGDNENMIRALGVEVGWMLTFGLALSNGLVALSGALLVQYQGYADVQMGLGMVVWGLASVIIGESLVGSRQIGMLLIGAVMGSVLFRLLVAIALRWGLNPNDLKLVTALFVLAALLAPNAIQIVKGKMKGALQT